MCPVVRETQEAWLQVLLLSAYPECLLRVNAPVSRLNLSKFHTKGKKQHFCQMFQKNSVCAIFKQQLKGDIITSIFIFLLKLSLHLQLAKCTIIYLYLLMYLSSIYLSLIYHLCIYIYLFICRKKEGEILLIYTSYSQFEILA